MLSARRSDLAELLKRDEAQRAGAYLLLGDDETAIGDTRCYIGEADVVSDRLRIHNRDKDFWDRVIVVASKDANLTKSHGRYLESRLIALAASPWTTARRRQGRQHAEGVRLLPGPARATRPRRFDRGEEWPGSSHARHRVLLTIDGRCRRAWSFLQRSSRVATEDGDTSGDWESRGVEAMA